ncbi:MAG: TlpA family protein disulfide reductase [Nitrospiraceae bacterium]|nr:TlpA family protein disulfide reductase [Nitrospiraceae bacterium]
MNNKGLLLLIILIAGIAAIFFAVGRDGSQSLKASTGLEAPDFSLTDLDGKVWKLSDLRGKVVFLNFWATWCDSCKTENPTIQNLINLEKNNPDFVFLTILYNDRADNAREYMRKNSFTFPVLIDNAKTAKNYGLTGVPETFIIDAKGIVRDKIVGPFRWDSPDAQQAISKLK